MPDARLAEQLVILGGDAVEGGVEGF